MHPSVSPPHPPLPPERLSGSPCAVPAPDNTIVTIGDNHYLWGIFLLVASARKAGMEEPFLVGCKGFGEREERVLRQLGNVGFVRLDGERKSLTCCKAKVILKAGTDFVSWVDSDGFFTGNVSEWLPPEDEESIHARMRAPAELPGRSWNRKMAGDGRSVPAEVLGTWQRDVAAVAGNALPSPRFASTVSACIFSLSLRRHGKFLEVWDVLQDRVLPARDVGVVDRSLRIYPQLDESTLNACLAFAPDAPAVQDYKLDKDRSRLYMHFIGQPKPWTGWTRRAFRFFDEYVEVAEWAAARGFELPGPLPPSLDASRKRICRALIPWTTLKPKLAKRIGRLFRRPVKAGPAQ